MNYKGISYEIAIRPGNNEWTWTIKPTLSASHSGEIRGSRQYAEFAAKEAIERWLKKNSKNETATDGMWSSMPSTARPR